MQKRSIFQTLDEQIFKQVDTFKNSKVYAQYNELLSRVNDKQQKYINMAISYLVISLPALVTLIIFMGNLFTSMELNEKESILKEIDKFNSTKAKVSNLGRNLITTYLIANKNSLANRMKNATSSASIPASNISVVSFENIKEMNEMKQARGELTFKNFSIISLKSIKP